MHEERASGWRRPGKVVIVRRTEPGPAAARRREGLRTTPEPGPAVARRARRRVPLPQSAHVGKTHVCRGHNRSTTWLVLALLALVGIAGWAGKRGIGRVEDPVRAAATPAPKATDPEVLEMLGVLAEGNDAERRQAASYIGFRTKDPVVVEPLVEVAALDASPEVRAEAAWALGMVGDERAVEPLLAVARLDRSEAVRLKAMWALGELEAAQAVDLLIEALVVPAARNTARLALEKVGEPAVEPLYARLLETDATLEADLPEIRRQMGRRTVAFLVSNIKPPRQDEAVEPVSTDGARTAFLGN